MTTKKMLMLAAAAGGAYYVYTRFLAKKPAGGAVANPAGTANTSGN